MVTTSISQDGFRDVDTTVQTDPDWFTGFTHVPLPAAPPQFVVRAAIALRQLLLRCADAVCPPEVAIVDRVTGITYTHLLGVAARLRIADRLEKGGPLTARDLAQQTKTHEDALHRLLRALASVGIFALDPRGRFSNSRLSRALVSTRSPFARAMVEYFSSAANVAAWADLQRTVESGQNAFARVHGMNLWQWFDAHPDEAHTFGLAMMGFSVGAAPEIAALYPFHEIRQLCDVGGGNGLLLSELLLIYPEMRGILYETSSVLASARRLFEQRGVAERVECVSGSFLERIPTGCDAYLFKSTLHDWSDTHCKQILGHVRRAIPSHGRLLIADLMIERNETQATATNVDVHMMVACEDGRERSRSDFEVLLDATGFRLTRVFRGPLLSVIEALPV